MTRRINVIVATDSSGGIGKDGGMPWPRHSGDMKWFRENTMGGIVLMGRKTWDSLNHVPLEGRMNMVFTSDESVASAHQNTHDNLWISANHDPVEVAMLVMSREGFPDYPGDVWVIGGATLYDQLAPLVDRVYRTKFRDTYDCDTFFPANRYDNFCSWGVEYYLEKDGAIYTVEGRNSINGHV